MAHLLASGAQQHNCIHRHKGARSSGPPAAALLLPPPLRRQNSRRHAPPAPPLLAAPRRRRCIIPSAAASGSGIDLAALGIEVPELEDELRALQGELGAEFLVRRFFCEVFFLCVCASQT